ncbi:MAG: hypothetical protein J3Q66DRAFT_25068 [Benniella sp.]|nr:MAG: hypothetical protein J3Q66DRAFT_25068 [Benniella sp.]
MYITSVILPIPARAFIFYSLSLFLLSFPLSFPPTSLSLSTQPPLSGSLLISTFHPSHHKHYPSVHNIPSSAHTHNTARTPSMKFILFTIATLVACSSRVSAAPTANSTAAPPPQGTYGHTVVVANNTVFIQGGSTSKGLSPFSYAIILDQNKSLANATWQDTSKLSTLTPRNYGVAAATDNVMITCGTDEGGKAGISCDQFDVIWYNKTIVDPAGIPNRAGMAVAYSAKNNKAYFVGGYGNNNIPVATVTVATLPTSNSAALQLDKGTDFTGAPRKFLTATWVDALNGIVVLGGQIQGDVPLPFNPAYVFDAVASTWSQV